MGGYLYGTHPLTTKDKKVTMLGVISSYGRFSRYLSGDLLKIFVAIGSGTSSVTTAIISMNNDVLTEVTGISASMRGAIGQMSIDTTGTYLAKGGTSTPFFSYSNIIQIQAGRCLLTL